MLTRPQWNAASAAGVNPPPPLIKPLPRSSGEGVITRRGITPPLPETGSGGAGGGVGRSPKRTRQPRLPARRSTRRGSAPDGEGHAHAGAGGGAVAGLVFEELEVERVLHG